MQMYMEALNGLLAGRKLSSGELLLLWLGGECVPCFFIERIRCDFTVAKIN